MCSSDLPHAISWAGGLPYSRPAVIQTLSKVLVTAEFQQLRYRAALPAGILDQVFQHGPIQGSPDPLGVWAPDREQEDERCRPTSRGVIIGRRLPRGALAVSTRPRERPVGTEA